MVAITFALAIVPAFVACATASESTTKFDSSAYKMREVGARNTVVSDLNSIPMLY